MALKKPTILNTGVTAEYWRFVGALDYKIADRYILLMFALYTNREARLAGFRQIRQMIGVRLEGDKFDQYFSNAVLDQEAFAAQAYAAAKAEIVKMEEGDARWLEGAEDVD